MFIFCEGNLNKLAGSVSENFLVNSFFLNKQPSFFFFAHPAYHANTSSHVGDEKKLRYFKLQNKKGSKYFVFT